jgi:cyclically-permuted mutarotase family protein
MNHVTISALLVFLFFTADLTAQKSKVNSIKWDIAGVLPSTNGKPLGFAGPVVGVSNNAFIVGGGANFPDSMPWLGGKKRYYDDLYVFKKDNRDSLVGIKAMKLPFALAYSANVSFSNGIIVVGGENESGISNKVLMMQWSAAAQNITIKNLPELPFAVTNASAVIHENKVYLAGGEMVDKVSDHFLFLDLNDIDREWKELLPVPKPISHAVMVVQSNGKDDCIYLIGGRKKNTDRPSDLYSSTLQFDLNTKEWQQKKTLPYGLSAGTGIAFGTNSVLLFGGDNGSTFHKTEELIFAISNEKNEEKKKQLVAEKLKLQSAHPGFCKQVLLYNAKKDEWKAVGCIPYDSPVTTTAVKWNDEVTIPGGEIRAGVRTPQILSAIIY